MKKLILLNKIKNLALVLVCLLIVCVMIFTFAACSNKAKQSSPDQIVEEPSGEEQQGDTDEPTDNPTDDPTGDEPSEEELLASFLTSVANVQGKNATTTITVSLGGITLAQKKIIYTRTNNGGSVTIETTTLAEAGAQNPCVYEAGSPEALSEGEFTRRFPTLGNFVNAETLDAVDYALSEDGNSLTFTLARDLSARLLSLTDEEAENVASDVSIRVAVASSSPLSFTASYTSSNGNAVTISILYV